MVNYCKTGVKLAVRWRLGLGLMLELILGLIITYVLLHRGDSQPLHTLKFETWTIRNYNSKECILRCNSPSDTNFYCILLVVTALSLLPWGLILSITIKKELLCTWNLENWSDQRWFMSKSRETGGRVILVNTSVTSQWLDICIIWPKIMFETANS